MKLEGHDLVVCAPVAGTMVTELGTRVATELCAENHGRHPCQRELVIVLRGDEALFGPLFA